MAFEFEWDPAKGAANRRKHRVGFEEAASAFADPLSITIPDPDHSAREARYLLLGASRRGRVLVVAHTERGRRVRLISARPATRRERRDYEEGNK